MSFKEEMDSKYFYTRVPYRDPPKGWFCLMVFLNPSFMVKIQVFMSHKKTNYQKTQ